MTKAPPVKLTDKIGITLFRRLRAKYESLSLVDAEVKGEKLALMIMRLDKKHRTRSISNFRLAYPEMTEAEAKAQTVEMYRHFGRIAADFMRTGVRTDQEVLDSMEVVGLENLLEAEAKGKGIIAVTAHFGNWERLAHWLSATGRTIGVIVRDANQGPLAEEILKMRRSQRIEVYSRGAAARPSLSLLRKNGILGILPDQNSSEMFVPFFGKPCGTVVGPAALSAKTGATVLPAYGVWIAPGQYRLEILPPLKPEPGFDEIEGMMRAVHSTLEAKIREHPAQWLWMHDRWKSARQRGLL